MAAAKDLISERIERVSGDGANARAAIRWSRRDQAAAASPHESPEAIPPESLASGSAVWDGGSPLEQACWAELPLPLQVLAALAIGRPVTIGSETDDFLTALNTLRRAEPRDHLFPPSVAESQSGTHRTTSVSRPRLVPEWRRCPAELVAGLRSLALPAPQVQWVEAGIRYLAGDLDGCHRICQTLEDADPTGTAAYWHALMHRAEPDFGNAKYWFRAVGSHPAMTRLASLVREAVATGALDAQIVASLIPGGRWSAPAMVDRVAQATRSPGDHAAIAALETIQLAEALTLLAACSGGEHHA